MSNKKEEGVKLLKRGKSYREVSDQLKVAKSTICGWVSSLDEEEKTIIKQYRVDNWRKSIKNYQILLRRKTLSKERLLQEESSKAIQEIDRKELLLIGSSLYWAEGSKFSRWQIQFSNSDPEMIKLMIRFFIEVCNIHKDKFYMQMILHEGIEEKEALKYWSEITNVPTNQFKKACYSISKSSNRVRPRNSLPFGTLQIRILDKNVTHQVYGFVLGLKKLARNNLTH